MGWQPIETAPKDGRVFLGWLYDVPVFAAWVPQEPDDVKISGIWPFRKSVLVKGAPGRFAVLMLNREWGYSIHGNYQSYQPTHWTPLPEPPK